MAGQIKDGGPAFPVYDHHADGQQFLAVTGMTLRDYLAAKALQGLLSDSTVQANKNEFAAEAYAMADAMLAAREST